MTKRDPEGPNAEQIRYWNEEAGPKWIALADRLDAHVGPLGQLAIERARPAADERALDVGCGCGQSTLQLAERVGETGHVTGVDVCAGMLERARGRAREARVRNVRFEALDAQTAALGAASFDLVFSRFGVMFFADAVRAFANLGSALAPGGRVAFVCWQEIRKNSWALEPLAAAARHLPLPAAPGPGEPGPFSLGDPERVRGILRRAGFERVQLEGVETEIAIGGADGIDEALDFLLQIGPTAAALRQAGDGARDKAAASVREVLAAHATAQGVRMDAAVWVVSARAASGSAAP